MQLTLCIGYCQVCITCTTREHEGLKMRRGFQPSHY